MLDLSVYAVTDPKYPDLVKKVEDAIRGGVTIVQFRAKDLSTEDIIIQARKIQKITKAYRIPLIINDDVKAAMILDADGVHVGQEDLPVNKARKLIGPDKILGVSVDSVEQALKAAEDGANYLGIGPVFPTMSKKDAGKPIGVELLKKIVERVSIPTVAIGGVNFNNAGLVLDCGVDGLAVISYLFDAKDSEIAARNLRGLVNERLEMRKSLEGAIRGRVNRR